MPKRYSRADNRAVVEAEEILRAVSEVAAPQIAREAVRQPEVALVLLQRRRRRQVDQVQLGFGPPNEAVRVGAYWSAWSAPDRSVAPRLGAATRRAATSARVGATSPVRGVEPAA